MRSFIVNKRFMLLPIMGVFKNNYLKGEYMMKKPIYEEYITASHLQRLSPEAREKIFLADSRQYQEFI